MSFPTTVDPTGGTEEVLARRMEAVRRMYAGAGAYEEVLAHHADDFVWLSPDGPVVGREAARAHHARRMARLPAEAVAVLRFLHQVVYGEYAFVTFRTDAVPFGTDTYRVVDGKVVFQSNALYLPLSYRRTGGGVGGGGAGGGSGGAGGGGGFGGAGGGSGGRR